MMRIAVNMFGEDYEQDIGPLIRSFYPGCELKILHDAEELPEADMSILFFLSRSEIKIKGIGEETVLTTDANDRKSYRNVLLGGLYRLLSKETGTTLPWGVLTGIRPAKIVMEQLEKGNSDVRTYMKEQYMCSDEKTELAIEVATLERELLQKKVYADGYSIYVGTPFCPSICNYCSFGSTPLRGNEALVEPYLAALKKEISALRDVYRDRPVSSVYFGGGTPTSLSASQLEGMIEHVCREFSVDPSVTEFTVEAGRPDSITRDKLTALKNAGVNRISINPQTMSDRTLELIGRRHTADDIDAAFALARECGHKNINMDLIIGLTGETPEDVEYTLSRIEKLDPESLTVHTLARKRAARLVTDSAKYDGLEAKNVLRMHELTREYVKTHGYRPYYMYRQKNMSENLENIGYSKPGFESLYNILIMEEIQTILAFGAGTVTKRVYPTGGRIERCDAVKNVPIYIERIDEMIERKIRLLAD